MKKLALVLSILVVMCGCSSNQPSSASLIAVTITPGTPPSIDQGQTMAFSASLTNDTGNKGVTWTLSGPGCSGSVCGSLTNVTTTSVTYKAPATVTANLGITLTATSVASTTQTAVATFFVMPPPSITTTDLPNATPTENYNVTLQATGGVQPLNWTIASGALPAGLHLNSAGEIYGIPTAGGTSSFTLKVTDSSAAPGGTLSTQQTLGLTVVGVLTVTAGSLPSGTVGVAYSTTLPYSGGTLPLSWSVYSGSLPSGVVLQQGTGVISGTPTVQGTYSFAVTVVDSSPTQQTYTSTNFTVTINPSGPLTIRTTALLDGTVDAAYQGQLVATGGTPPLSWTTTAGALPSGLALGATTGVISGLPTAAPGTYSFTVAVADASVPQQTRTQSLSITVDAAAPVCSSSGNNSVLLGQYAFSLRGYNGVGFLALVGSFTADGTGKITAGEADTNGVLGAQNGNLIISASSYSVGPDNRGCATLATPFGTFFTRFAVGAVSAGIATQGRIIEFDNPGASAYIAAGQIIQQTPSAFIVPLTGSYALRTAGWDSATSGRVTCSGIIIGARLSFSYLQQDCNDNGTVTNTTTTSTGQNGTLNTYTTADANGRGTAIVSLAGNVSDLTFYWVSATQLFIVNSDPGPFFSGDWKQEEVPIGSSGFNQNSFNGKSAFYASGLGSAGGDVSIATQAADGVSSVSTRLYRDIAGAWQTPNPSTTTCSYSVVLIGRVTFGGGSCGADPPIPYLNSLNTAYVVGTDPTVELGSFEPITAGLTNAALAGTYFAGTSEVVSQSVQANVAIVTLSSGGVVTSTTDAASILSQTAGTASSDTYTLNADGTLSTGSSGGTIVGIAISGSKFVLVNSPTLTFPTLQVGQR
jgi:hypothetical protein